MPYYFNLPLITELTIEQQAALNETAALALSGSPGTGKSVVCLWRHIRNHSLGKKNSLLLTYTKTLEFYLKECASGHNNKASAHIDRTHRWASNGPTHYDEIIIDEGQDVESTHYNSIRTYATSICYSADDAQSLYSNGSTLAEMNQLFPNNESYTLYKNFRNSREILEFIRSTLPNIPIPQSTLEQAYTTNLKPIVKICGREQVKEIEYICEIINTYAGDTHNIGVLVPLIDNVNEYYELIKSGISAGIDCSKYTSNDEIFSGFTGVHVTTFKSSKGTEFDTVVIPNFDNMTNAISSLYVVSEKDYYVAFTRAKTNLFLTCGVEPTNVDSNTVEMER
jgi:superfamily I DNA/RNA helicase